MNNQHMDGNTMALGAAERSEDERQVNPKVRPRAKRRAETAKTYVAHRGGRIVGYHALVAGSVLKYEAPERIAQGIAKHPEGVILLARLAVDNSGHG